MVKEKERLLRNVDCQKRSLILITEATFKKFCFNLPLTGLPCACFALLTTLSCLLLDSRIHAELEYGTCYSGTFLWLNFRGLLLSSALAPQLSLRTCVVAVQAPEPSPMTDRLGMLIERPNNLISRVVSSVVKDSRDSLSVAGPVTQSGSTLSPTSLAAFKLYFILLVPSMASICVGFDIAVMSYINGMEPYLRYFNLKGQDSGGGIGTSSALNFRNGTCLTVLFAGPISDRFGRRGALFSGAFLCVVGSVTVTVARNVAYLKAGRFFLGMSTALLEVSAPMYVVEISPPQACRSQSISCSLAIALMGSLLSGIITTVTSRLNSTASWRIPLSIQIVPAAISPRWLMSVGRKSEARLILSRYHGNNSAEAPLVVLESNEIEESIQAKLGPTWDYTGLFNTRSARYRTFLLVLMALCGQLSGSGLSYFLPVLLASNHSWSWSLVNNIVGAIGGVCGAVFSDKVGRRTLWFWGTVSCAITLIISGAWLSPFLTCDPRLYRKGSNAAIAFLFLFNFFFCATYLTLPAVYPSECLSYENRETNVAASYTLIASCASFVNTYATPVALEKIQWKLYYVFIAWDVFASIVIWCCAVETAGRTLSDRHPVKASRKTARNNADILNLAPRLQAGNGGEIVV
ncbi:hypothetical protein C8J57DRAFT_1279928 [Mycena rebaudengoi]|nr:hypothetical protein C8J57DRAFT_1279928 [Mycena rebaudengoi]